jgi:hypothetical protein
VIGDLEERAIIKGEVGTEWSKQIQHSKLPYKGTHNLRPFAKVYKMSLNDGCATSDKAMLGKWVKDLIQANKRNNGRRYGHQRTD